MGVNPAAFPSQDKDPSRIRFSGAPGKLKLVGEATLRCHCEKKTDLRTPIGSLAWSMWITNWLF